MDFQALIRKAWDATWHIRWLWVLGLFAGGVSAGNGLSYQFNGGPSRTTSMSPGSVPAIETGTLWLESHPALVAAIVGAAVLLIVALVVVSVISQGAISRATAEIAVGQPTTLGTAWREGLHLFWRFLGLGLLLMLAVLAVGLLVGTGIALMALGWTTGQPFGTIAGLVVLAGVAAAFVWLTLDLCRAVPLDRRIAAAVAIAGAILVVPILLFAAVASSLLVTYAQREIAVENIGPVDGLRRSWRLLREHLGESFLAWLVSVALSVVAAAGLFVAVALVALVLLAIGAGVFMLAGLGAPTISYAVVAGVAAVAAVLALVGLSNTFFWSFWTLAFLQLRGDERIAPSAAI